MCPRTEGLCLETKYELRASFDDDAGDILASEDDGNFYLEQEEALICVPKDSADAFFKKLVEWISYGRSA